MLADWSLQTEVEADNVEKLALKATLRKVLARRRLEEFSSLVNAAKEWDVDMVRTLLVKGADINMVDYDGRSALAMVSSLLIHETTTSHRMIQLTCFFYKGM